MAANKITTHQEDTPPIEVKKSLCFVQITRLGDLLQTYQAAKLVREQHPDVRLILVARKQFAAPLMFLLNEVFDKCYLFNLKDIYNNSDQSLKGMRDNLTAFTKDINTENISVLMNLSYSKSSSYLSALIQADHKVGPYYDKKSNLLIHDRWSQFVYSNVMGGALNPFSLVDVFRSIIGVKPQVNASNTNSQPSKKTEKVVIHPFASQERKRWKSAKWVELIYKTLKEHKDIKIQIVGSGEEAQNAKEISNDPILQNFQSRIENLAGKTDIKSLYETLQDADLFIGHDSMVGHLASIAQTQTLTLSLGSVRPHETTPYGLNNYNLAPKTKCFPCFPTDKCDFYQCHADIPYQTAYLVAKQLIETGTINSKQLNDDNSAFHLNSVDLYRSTITSTGRLELIKCIDHNPDLKEIFRKIYRVSWLYLFEESEEKQNYSPLTDLTHAELLRYMEGARQLFDLAEFGKKYSRYILEEVSSQTPNLSKIKEFSKKIDEIDGLTLTVKKTYQFLSPVIDFFSIAKANIPGSNLVELTESSFYAYNDCSLICQIIYELIEQTISEHKIYKDKSRQQITSQTK